MQLVTKRGTLVSVKGDRMICPECGAPMQGRILQTTRLLDYPAYCKRCRKEFIISSAPAPQRQRQMI